MARIDKLLRTLAKNTMDVVEMQPGNIPVMRKRNRTWNMSKSPLAAREIERLLVEIAPSRADFPPPLPTTTYEFEYPLDHTSFHVRARRRADGWTAAIVEKDVDAPPVEPGPIKDEEEESGEATVVIREVVSVDDVLRLASERGASDLHLSARQAPRLRIDGDLRELPFQPPSPERVESLLEELIPDRNREELGATNDTDFGYEIDGLARYRVNVFRDRHGLGAVFREIPSRIPSAADIGLTEEITNLAHLSKGLVLVTGPTGSGKSTTLAAIIDRVNTIRSEHIITIEDPIEFVHSSRRCLINQREVRVHTGSFATALRAALREDPDVVLVGEMRDLETTSMALETAETGHLVLGTLHTTSAISTVDRLINQYPADRQAQIRLMLADSLKAVISQTLLKRVGGGRVAAREVLLVNGAVSNLIREAKTFQIASVLQTNRAAGMRTLNDSLMELVNRDVVDPKEAYVKAVDKSDLVRRYQQSNVDRGFLEEFAA